MGPFRGEGVLALRQPPAPQLPCRLHRLAAPPAPTLSPQKLCWPLSRPSEQPFRLLLSHAWEGDGRVIKTSFCHHWGLLAPVRPPSLPGHHSRDGLGVPAGRDGCGQGLAKARWSLVVMGAHSEAPLTSGSPPGAWEENSSLQGRKGQHLRAS